LYSRFKLAHFITTRPRNTKAIPVIKYINYKGVFNLLHEILYHPQAIISFKDMLEQSVNLFGNKNAFLMKSSNDVYQGITYNEFKNDVDALGTALISLGLKDQSIAVIGENRYEWCVTYLAAANGVGVIVPLDKELPVADIENLLTISTASAIVFSGKSVDKIKKTVHKLTSVKYFIGMDLEQDEPGFLSFRQLVKKGKQLLQSGDRAYLDATVDPEGLSVLLFTSGTTGFAKGVMLSHKNICSNVMAVSKVLYFGPADVALSILPVHHTYECTCGFLLMIYCGCTIAFNEGLKHIAKNLKESKASLLFAVPLIVESMYKKIWEHAAKEGKANKLKTGMLISNILKKGFRIDLRRKIFKPVHDSLGGGLRLILTGAAAIDPGASKGFRAMGVDVLQGYGLTECAPMAVVNGDKWHKCDSIGLPLPGVDIKIDNPGRDGMGEILVRGDNVMLGYFNNQAETERILRNGWLYTGDLGHMDRRGFIYITGRKKNVIVTKNGKNIYPEEMEAYLDKSLYILESLVWGKYDESSGETYVNAQIYPNLEAIQEELGVVEASEEEIRKIIAAEIKALNKSIPMYKNIREFTIRDQEFEKTTTRKIKRYVDNVGEKQAAATKSL
jgi:long-chain acyl-CoA synthetase